MKINLPSKKTVMQLMLVVLIILVIRAWQQESLTAGQVPNFSSKTLTGEMLSSAPMPDKAVLIHFWATWCLVCTIEKGNIESIAEDYKVLNIAIQSGTDEEVRAHAQENNMRLDNIINDQSGSISKLFGIRGTPSSFVINTQGKIQFSEVGYVTTWGYRLRLWWASL